MANIAEGFDGGSDCEFVKFLGYAIRSSTELQSHLYVALDQGNMDQDTFAPLYAQTVRVMNLTSGIIRYLRSRPKTLHLEPWTEDGEFNDAS